MYGSILVKIQLTWQCVQNIKYQPIQMRKSTFLLHRTQLEIYLMFKFSQIIISRILQAKPMRSIPIETRENFGTFCRIGHYYYLIFRLHKCWLGMSLIPSVTHNQQTHALKRRFGMGHTFISFYWFIFTVRHSFRNVCS